VIVGTLFADRLGNIFMLHSEVLDKVSHTTVAILFDSAMKMLWKNEVKRDRIQLFITDATPYMPQNAIPKNGPLNMSCAWPPQSGRRNPRKLS
jgi:hypothetical protein